MKFAHLDIFTSAERLHRKFLDVIQLELDRLAIRDVNAVRALILLNLNDNEMTISELMYRGCYLGTNVSYNLKKLTESGYIDQVRSAHDRRVVMVQNSSKASELCAVLGDIMMRHMISFKSSPAVESDLAVCRRALRTLEQSCTRAIERRQFEEPAQRLVTEEKQPDYA